MTVVTRNTFVIGHARIILAAAFCVAFFLFQPAAYLRAQGQSAFASLNGTVRDSTGAVAPGASVTLSDPERNFSRTFTTGTDGTYVFALVSPGTYTLKATATGFATYLQEGVILAVAQTATQDITLTVGRITEQVTVTATTPLLNTSNANIGSEVTARETVELPLNVRNPFYLVTLNSSVNNSSQGQALSASVPSTEGADAAFFNFGGSIFGTTAFLLDGHWDGSWDWTGLAYVPGVDETGEFNIQTNAFTAQYGMSMGNVINAVTKSGTREIHGDAFEFLRNSDLDANNFFNNATGQPRSQFKRNQFGGTIGGPLYIPKLYEQRDKTFIFGSFEGLRQSSPYTFIGTLPTQAMRTGDFAALLGSQIGTDALGRPVLQGQLYDPFTTREITQGAVDPVTGLLATESGFIRDPISGNQLQSMLNPASKLLESYYPNPTTDALANNYVYASGIPSAYTKYTIRVDQNISDKARFFARYSQTLKVYRTEGPTVLGASNPAGPGDRTLDPRWDIGVGYTRTFGPTFVMSISAGGNRWEEVRQPQGVPFKPSTVGLPSLLDTVRPIFPDISIDGTYGLGSSGVTVSSDPVTTVAVDFTKTQGKHTLNFGYQHIRFQINSLFNYPGSFHFPVSMTQGPDPTTANSNTGYGFASFLLGTGDSGNLQINAADANTKNYDGWYIEDQFKVSSKLTATFGLRYDIQWAPTERFNRIPYFDFSAANPLQAALAEKNGGTAPFAVPGELVYLSPSKRGVYDPQFNNFAPRLSAAYRVTNNLVARAGFGMFYAPDIMGGDYQGLTLPGFSQTTPYVGTVDGITPVNLISNPFPNGILLPAGSSEGGLTYVGQQPDAMNRKRPNPYVEQWMFGWQYGAGSGNTFDVTYVGNHGVKLIFPAGFQLDQLPTQDLSLGSSLLDPVTNPFYGLINSSSCGVDQATVPRGQLLRPYPEYCGLGGTQPPGAFSSYNGVTFSYNHRWSQGLQFLASYTISKFLDNTSGNEGWASAGPTTTSYRNYYNTAAEKSLDMDDIPQSLVLSYIYQLPVGRGKHFGSNMGKLADAVVGGWQVSGVSTFKKGFPLGIADQTNNTNSLGGNQFPNLVGNPKARPAGVDRIDEWFNTAAFAQPAPFTFGNSPRFLPNTRSPGINNFDLAAEKWFQLQEHLKMEFRAEFYNAFNHTNLIAPNQVYGSPTFGAITLAAPPRDIQFGLKLVF
jgi:hypothetical protein